MEIRPAAPARAFVTPEQRRERRRVDPPRPRRAGPPPAGRGRLISRSLRGHAGTGFRPDIEGLRAIAVLAVVLYHVRFPGVRGGFVGVDVFFVVSGFLITRLLLAELAATGTVSRRRFWARRARRILPAATLTRGRHRGARAAACSRRWHCRRSAPTPSAPARSRSTSCSPTASATTSVPQLGATNPSPLLHYWSLAVEEQFYLVLAGAAGAAHTPAGAVPPAARRHRDGARRGRLRGSGCGSPTNRPSWAFFLLPGAHGRAPRRRRTGCRRRRRAPARRTVAGRCSGGSASPASWSPARRSTSRCPGPGGRCCCRCSPRWR